MHGLLLVLFQARRVPLSQCCVPLGAQLAEFVGVVVPEGARDRQ